MSKYSKKVVWQRANLIIFAQRAPARIPAISVFLRFPRNPCFPVCLRCPQFSRFLRFPGVSYGFLWFPMVFYGFLWFPMVSDGFLWFTMVFTVSILSRHVFYGPFVPLHGFHLSKDLRAKLGSPSMRATP